jgi:hypothetical protein
MGMKDNIQIIIFEKKYQCFNRYELEQRRSNRNEINYSQNRSHPSRVNTSQRGASQRDISK